VSPAPVWTRRQDVIVIPSPPDTIREEMAALAPRIEKLVAVGSALEKVCADIEEAALDVEQRRIEKRCADAHRAAKCRASLAGGFR